MKISALCMLVILTTYVSANQKFYKWTDASGNTHYSQEKPENQKSAELQLNEPAPKLSVANDHNENRASNQQRIAQLYKEREESQKKNQERANKCNKAKAIIKKFQKQTRFGKRDKKTGETLFLEDKQREIIIKSAKQALRQNCR